MGRAKEMYIEQLQQKDVENLTKLLWNYYFRKSR